MNLIARIVVWTVIVTVIPFSAPLAGGPQNDRSGLVERIQEAKDALQQPAAILKSGPGVTRTGPAARQALRPRPDEARVIIRPGRGTPRQVRGRSLQPAADDLPAGPERDRETARRFLRSLRGTLQLVHPDAELTLTRTTADRLGYRHLRYRQTHRGIPVWPAEAIVHLDPAGNVRLMAGSTVPTPRRKGRTPRIDAADAVLRAKAAVRRGESAEVEGPEKIFFPTDSQGVRLAWKMSLTVSPVVRYRVIIDALTGEVLTAYNTVPTAAADGWGDDLMGNRRPLNLWHEGGAYYMVDTSKPMYQPNRSNPPHPDAVEGGIVVLDAENQPPTDEVEEITHIDYVTSSVPDSGWLPDAVSAAYNLSETYDYYYERHGRNSVDDNGSTLLAIVRIGEGYPNAAWANDFMIFGDARPYAAALDVVAHELTHGVTINTANLIYKNESGALNESFSDIFGEAVEAYSVGSADWINGTGLNEANARNLADPASVEIAYGRRYPSRMSEYIELDDPYLDFFKDRDNGGVHINMTIVAHAFYLLAEGMNGAIGIADAERIFYRALAHHLVASSRFVDCRLACVASAEELFGEGSIQARRTAEAFDAVEIYEGSPTPSPDETEFSPPAEGDEALLFVYYDDFFGDYYLGRRESGDPASGVRLSTYPVAPARPSVTEDGEMAVFVDSLFDMCFILTNGSKDEYCLGEIFLTASVAMSPDGSLYSFVLLDDDLEPGNVITVIDIDTESRVDYTLVAPAFDGAATNTVIRADAMSFTSDNRYLIYDALNRIQLIDGSIYEAWSIYALDLRTGQTLVLMPPNRDLDIGYPALSQTNDNFVTFDAFHPSVGGSDIRVLNMIKNYISTVSTSGNWGTPVYTTDDGAILYSRPDDATPTGFSIWRHPLASDRMTSTGEPSLYMANADYATAYRGPGGSGDGGAPAPEPAPDAGDSGNDGGGGGGGCFMDVVGSPFPLSAVASMVTLVAVGSLVFSIRRRRRKARGRP